MTRNRTFSIHPGIPSGGHTAEKHLTFYHTTSSAFSVATGFAPENVETAGYEQVRCFAENPPGLDMMRSEVGIGHDEG